MTRERRKKNPVVITLFEKTLAEKKSAFGKYAVTFIKLSSYFTKHSIPLGIAPFPFLTYPLRHHPHTDTILIPPVMNPSTDTDLHAKKRILIGATGSVASVKIPLIVKTLIEVRTGL